MQKRRILVGTEFSELTTGFATYGREILKRLQRSGKYELAEYGSYGTERDPRAKALPWKFYGALPNNPKEEQVYKGNQFNQFGLYKYDSVLVDFQPDIYFGFRDPWMMQHTQNSRFRDKYKLLLMPTVDSEPQKKDWVDGLFRKADALFTYSRYGKRVLESEGLKVFGVPSPGVDLDVFRPMNREEIRRKWCLNNELFVIGTVMRNQKRKLFPDLFEAYATLRHRYKDNEKIQKSVLFCHTSFPDLGWDIPELISRTNIQRHVIFTYICESCNNSFLSWFIPCNSQGIGQCVVCGQHAAHMPNTNKGLSVEEFAEIYNVMDVYVQLSICEGWGVPIVESKACGVPGLYSNYSAMEDHVANGGGLPIKIERMYTEAETMAKRSLPSRDDLVSKLKMLISKPDKLAKMSKEARSVAEEKHSWDRSAKIIEEAIDTIEIHDRANTWNAPLNLKPINTSRPAPNMSDQEFVLWCYLNILGRKPDEKGFSDWMQNLSKGKSREEVEKFFRSEIEGFNRFEMARWKHSLRLRGIEGPNLEEAKSDNLSGVFV